MAGAAILGTLVGGGLSAGAAAAEETPLGPQDSYVYNLNLLNDPLNVAMSLDALAQLGNYTGMEQVLQRQSPLNQFRERLDQSTLTIEQKQTAMIIAERMYRTGQGWEAQPHENARNKEMETWNYVLGNAGIPREILGKLNPRSAVEFDRSIKDQVEQIKTSGVGAARQSAMKQLADRVLSMETGGNRNFDQMRDVASSNLEKDAEDQARRQREQILAAANAGGFNPAGLLGELERERLRTASLRPMQAVELASGLAAEEDRGFQNLLTYLGFGTQNAQNATHISNAGALGSAGIAANQLMAANQLRTEPQNKTSKILDSVGSSLSLTGFLAGSGSGSKPGVD